MRALRTFAEQILQRNPAHCGRNGWNLLKSHGAQQDSASELTCFSCHGVEYRTPPSWMLLLPRPTPRLFYPAVFLNGI